MGNLTDRLRKNAQHVIQITVEGAILIFNRECEPAFSQSFGCALHFAVIEADYGYVRALSLLRRPYEIVASMCLVFE